MFVELFGTLVHSQPSQTIIRIMQLCALFNEIIFSNVMKNYISEKGDIQIFYNPYAATTT